MTTSSTRNHPLRSLPPSILRLDFPLSTPSCRGFPDLLSRQHLLTGPSEWTILVPIWLPLLFLDSINQLMMAMHDRGAHRI